MGEEKKIESAMLTEDELEFVSGGVKGESSTSIEMGSKDQKPGAKDLPFLCRTKKCEKTFYISPKGANRVRCPFCNTVFTISG